MAEKGSGAFSFSALSSCRCPSLWLANSTPITCYHALPRNCTNVEDILFETYTGIRARVRHANLGIIGLLDFGSYAPLSRLLLWFMEEILARIASMREQEYSVVSTSQYQTSPAPRWSLDARFIQADAQIAAALAPRTYLAGLKECILEELGSSVPPPGFQP